MSPTIAEFTQAVEALKVAPFGGTLEAIKLHISDAKAELKPHMCPGYAAARLEELAYWMGVLRKFEEANEAMKLKDWSPVGQ